MNYMIRHTGTSHLEGSYSFDERTLYDFSGMTNVKTKCDCNFGKTINFYYDAEEDNVESQEAIAETIEKEIKAKYDNVFMHCDTCEEYILNEIKKEYI
tara:strand:- start:3116 stop:3409 length:294 start_codon:yes stop_codon:yes gene_type:complete